MSNLTREAKTSIIQKTINRGTKTVHQIAKENNVGYSTLTRWLSESRENKGEVISQKQCEDKTTSPLEHILATNGLDETQIGSYCRTNGIHSFQLTQWRNELMKYNGNQAQAPKRQSDLKALKSENKRLKQDLRRKEKALAETSALLVLKKKADLIWGVCEDD